MKRKQQTPKEGKCIDEADEKRKSSGVKDIEKFVHNLMSIGDFERERRPILLTILTLTDEIKEHWKH